MAVAFNTGVASHASASSSVSQASFSFNVTPSGTPRCAVVFVFSIAATDNGSSVTYGGTSMGAVAGGSASDTATEVGTVKAYFLDNIGSGLKSVVVTRTNNATAMWAVVLTFDAIGVAEVTGVVLLQENGAYAEQSVTDGSPGSNSVRCAGGFYGGNAPAAAGAASTSVALNDLGSFGCNVVYETTAGQGARNIGFTDATADDRAAVHFAVREANRNDAGTSSGTASFPGTEALQEPSTVAGVAALTDTEALVEPDTTVTALASFTGVENLISTDSGTVAGVGSYTADEALTDSGSPGATTAPTASESFSEAGTLSGATTPSAAEALQEPATVTAVGVVTDASASAESGTGDCTGAFTGSESFADVASFTTSADISGADALADSGTLAATAVHTEDEAGSEEGASVATVSSLGVEALADEGSFAALATLDGDELTQEEGAQAGTVAAAASFPASEAVADDTTLTSTGTSTADEALDDQTLFAAIVGVSDFEALIDEARVTALVSAGGVVGSNTPMECFVSFATQSTSAQVSTIPGTMSETETN